MDPSKVESLFALAGKNDNGPEALSAMKKAWKAFEAGGYAIVVRGERMFSRLEVERDFVPRSEIGRSLMLRAQVDAEYVLRATVLRDYVPRTQIPSVYVSRNFHDTEVARIRADLSPRGRAEAPRAVWGSGETPGPRAPAPRPSPSRPSVESDDGPSGYDDVSGGRRPQAPLRDEPEDRPTGKRSPGGRSGKASPPPRRGAPPPRRAAGGGGDGEWVRLPDTQYKGWCRACRAGIPAGSEAYWKRGEDGKSIMRCMDCGEG